MLLINIIATVINIAITIFNFLFLRRIEKKE
nr:MAG TPA: hypothetical protein [Caudoviricetes sp.]